MTLSKWQPFKELSSIRQQMECLFEALRILLVVS